MTFRERLLVHRQKLVPALVVMALGLAALLFRHELGAWFSGQPVSTGADAVATQSVQVGSLDVAVGFSPDPPRQKRNTLVLVVRDGTGKPVEGATVTVRYRMPPMGSMQEMRGDADITERGEGRYDARFDLPMGGSWELTVGIGKGDQTGQAAFNMTVGTPGLTSSGVSAAKADSTGGQALPAHDETSHYTCSMHPSVRQEGPGLCPICGMDLTPVTQQEVETGTIFVDEVRRQRIGVRTDKANRRALTLEIRAVGAVRYDETRLHDVNLRMSGWVQHLSVNETGQRVKAGQTLFTLYSPELYAAQLEHLTGVRRQAGGGGELLAHLARASRTRLELLGMTDGQISALEKRGEAQKDVPMVAPASGYVIEKQIVEGARVDAGMRVYRIADLSKVWIDAEIYESDLPHVHVGQSVEIELPYVGRKRYPGKVDYVYPTLDAQTRTGRARIILENPKFELKPDMYATVFISVNLGERLTVPDSAVVYTGPRRLVFVDLGEGKLQPKVVELGPHVDGYYAVTAGLSEGDVVVTSGNFLIAAESRIRSAAQYWESENDSE